MSRLKKSTFRDHIVWSLKNPKNKINLILETTCCLYIFRLLPSTINLGGNFPGTSLETTCGPRMLKII